MGNFLFKRALRRTEQVFAGLGVVAIGVCVASAAKAADAVDCTTLPNPVYFPATTLVEALVSKVAPVLADDTVVGADQMTLIHFPLSSCNAYEAHKEQTALVGTGTYYLTDGTPATCEMPVASTIKSDLTAIDVGGATCLSGEEPPKELVEITSHVETIGFVVPRNSTQTAITATEAYYLMKFGGEPGYEVAPWTNPKFIFVRTPGSSTQLTIGASIGIPGTMWNGSLFSTMGSGEVRDAIVAQNTTGNADKTIGILNSSKWEAASDNMKVLAFQPFNNCFGAVYPDSTATSLDKRNVRDGHYPIWTNLRYIKTISAKGKTTSDNGAAAAARVDRFIELMTGADSIDGLNVAQAVIKTGDIPACAMHVAREVDGGPIASYEPEAPCDCLFLEENGVDSGCDVCAKDEDCAEGSCRFGYCEAR
jgi:hypothetical protein